MDAHVEGDTFCKHIPFTMSIPSLNTFSLHEEMLFYHYESSVCVHGVCVCVCVCVCICVTDCTKARLPPIAGSEVCNGCRFLGWWRDGVD